MNINFKQVAISSIVFLIISQIINSITAVFTMSYYTNREYFALWSKVMMPANGPPGTEFFLASIIIDLIVGMILAGSYSLLADAIPGEGISKGINYGILLFLIAGVPFTLTVFLLFAVPGSLLVFWAISSLVIYLISGAVFAKIMVEKAK